MSLLNQLEMSYFDNSWILATSQDIAVEELNASGAAEVTFPNDSLAIYIKHLDNQPPLKWTKNRRCADAAIVVQEGDDLKLHVVELKSKLTRTEWLKAKEQCAGMVANTIAVLAVGGLGRPSAVVYHVSFTEDVVNDNNKTNTVLMKVPLGGKSIIGDVSDWKNSHTAILGYSSVEIRKILRDAATGKGLGIL